MPRRISALAPAADGPAGLPGALGSGAPAAVEAAFGPGAPACPEAVAARVSPAPAAAAAAEPVPLVFPGFPAATDGLRPAAPDDEPAAEGCEPVDCDADADSDEPGAAAATAASPRAGPTEPAWKAGTLALRSCSRLKPEPQPTAVIAVNTNHAVEARRTAPKPALFICPSAAGRWIAQSVERVLTRQPKAFCASCKGVFARCVKGGQPPVRLAPSRSGAVPGEAAFLGEALQALDGFGGAVPGADDEPVDTGGLEAGDLFGRRRFADHRDLGRRGRDLERPRPPGGLLGGPPAGGEGGDRVAR